MSALSPRVPQPSACWLASYLLCVDLHALLACFFKGIQAIEVLTLKHVGHCFLWPA